MINLAKYAASINPLRAQRVLMHIYLQLQNCKCAYHMYVCVCLVYGKTRTGACLQIMY